MTESVSSRRLYGSNYRCVNTGKLPRWIERTFAPIGWINKDRHHSPLIKNDCKTDGQASHAIRIYISPFINIGERVKLLCFAGERSFD